MIFLYCVRFLDSKRNGNRIFHLSLYLIISSVQILYGAANVSMLSLLFLLVNLKLHYTVSLSDFKSIIDILQYSDFVRLCVSGFTIIY